MMQKEKIIVDDNNRQEIAGIYIGRLLDDMDFDALYNFAFDMLRDSKEGLTNEQLQNQIIDYYPDILEN